MVGGSIIWATDGIWHTKQLDVWKVLVVEIVYMETDWIDLDCSRKLSIVVNVFLLTLKHAQISKVIENS